MNQNRNIKNRFGTTSVSFCNLAEVFSGLDACKCFVVTDSNVAQVTSFPADFSNHILPAGEETKSPRHYLEVIDWLASKSAKRSSTLVALGGGVIGDLAGFAASTYMRGINLVSIPTTLLAMVDSSIGGKVGVDLSAGKNLLGSFWPASEVRIAVDFLKTLPKRQVINGCAEVLKYGFIMRPGLLEKLSRSIDQQDFESVVANCIDCKAEVVEQDELEKSGKRAILNFGHTVGHAIESALGYRELLHGEAISIGMVVESEIGVRLGLTASETPHIIRHHLQKVGLPTRHPILSQADLLIEIMKLDKKSTGSLAMSLIPSIGSCELVSGIDEGLTKLTFEAVLNS